MTSQLRHFFQAIQAVHVADDITTPQFLSQVNSLRVCGTQVDTLKVGRSAQPYSINFELANPLTMQQNPFALLNQT